MTKTKDLIYVGIQAIIFSAFLWRGSSNFVFSPESWLFYLGWILFILGGCLLLLSLIQLNTNLSPFPTPKVTGQLITHGVFSIARHPIYSSILITGVGWGLHSGSLFRLLLTILLLILFYYKSRYEEGLLEKKYQDYQDYKKRTGRFLPKL